MPQAADAVCRCGRRRGTGSAQTKMVPLSGNLQLVHQVSVRRQLNAAATAVVLLLLLSFCCCCCCCVHAQVVTDNAQACRAAGALIEAQYPHITWSPCVAHVCDLALEGIFALSYFKEVHSNTKGFVGFINNHHHTLAAWRQHQENAEGSVLQLIKPGETRFASALLMIERTIKVKAKLQQFVVSDNWNNAIATMKAADKVRQCWKSCRAVNCTLPAPFSQDIG